MLVTVRPWSFEDIRIQVRGNPAAICLAATDRIDTPTGQVPVSQIRVGMIVWTLDATGRRVSASVLLVSHRTAPLDYKVLRLTLADGRTVEASPGHPTADGLHTDRYPEDPLVALGDLKARIAATIHWRRAHCEPPDQQGSAEDCRHANDVRPSDKQAEWFHARHRLRGKGDPRPPFPNMSRSLAR